jgi:hypothetical protein
MKRNCHDMAKAGPALDAPPPKTPMSLIPVI